MADPKDTKPEAEAVEQPKPQVLFLLKSVVRDRTNRTARAANAIGRVPFVQRLAGGIIVRRARPARITEAALLVNIEEIKKLVAQHRLVVTTLDGRVVTLDDLKAAPKALASPLPNPPLDSAKNDKNENIGYNVPPTPEGTTLDAPLPELLKAQMKEEVVEETPAPPVGEDPVDAFMDSMALPPEETPVEPAEPEETKKSSKSKGKRG